MVIQKSQEGSNFGMFLEKKYFKFQQARDRRNKESKKGRYCIGRGK